MERRSLLDGDATPTQERANVFGDEFEVDDDDFDGVADGFRPNVDTDGADSHPRQEHAERQPMVRSVSAHYGADAITPVMASEPARNSIRKSRTHAANPFASLEDDEPTTPHHDRHLSLEFEPDSAVRRSVSSASSSQFAPTHSPRFGAGPSHPYAIYPQGTMARTPSLATQSTVRPNARQSYSRSQPQHPYAMYPQGVDDGMDDDDDDSMPIQQNPVTVGFPGLGQNYTRRIGPDGEDQDLIGEDGHTEQLPPYSRYPEEGPEKMPLIPMALHSRAPVAGTDPSMPLMHTTIQPLSTPAPQSMTDESVLARHSTTGSALRLVHSHSSSENKSILAAKKKWSEKTWKEKRKTRFCGIPFWWILLALCVLTFIAAVLGGAIGGFLAGGKHARDKPTVTVVTSLYDASLIASPTSGAPPTGTFGLILGAPQETQCDCLPNTQEQPAWGCDLAPNAALAIAIDPPMNGQGSGARVLYASHDESIGYGAQLAYMNTSFARFLTVQDNDDPANGPAFYWQQFYDKVVVVPDGAINVNSKTKRGNFSPSWRLPAAWMYRKQVAKPGEKPWFCIWNGTFLEGFIYVTETMTTSTSSFATISASSATKPPSTPHSGSPFTPTSTPTPSQSSSGEPNKPVTGPGDTITKAATFGSTIATYTGVVSGFDVWASSLGAEEAKNAAEEAQRKAFQPVGHAVTENDDDDDDDDDHEDDKRKRQVSMDDYWSQLDVFPYLVKLEERRLPNNPIQPYCQQYQILDNGHANWVGDSDGNPIIVELDEQDPSFAAYESAGVASKSRKKRTIAGGCHCQWMSGEDFT